MSINWVLRRQNGYFVDGSEEHPEDGPFIFKVGGGRAIEGVDEGVRGMRKGGKRRIVVTPSLGYKAVGDGKPGPMPQGYGPQRQLSNRAKTELFSLVRY